MKKRVISAFLSMAMVASVFGAAVNVSAEEAHDPVELRFSWWGGDERHEATLAVIEAFEAEYPWITVEPEYGSSEGYREKLSTQLASGTAPDVVQIDPGQMPELIANGDYFFDLRAEGFDLSNFDEVFISKSHEGNFDGKQYGLPSGTTATTVLVNKGLAEKLGINITDEPFTWQDMIEMGKAVHEADETKYLFGVNTHYLTSIVTGTAVPQLTGSAIIPDATGEIAASTEDFTTVFEFIQALYDNNVVPPANYMAAFTGDNLQNDPNWINGNYVCTITYSSMLEVLMAAAPDVEFDIGQLPTWEDGADVVYSMGCPQLFSIPTSTEHKEEAMLFLDFWYNNETSMELQKCTRSLPPTAKAREICAQTGSLNELVAKAADVCEGYLSENSFDDSTTFSTEGFQIISDAIDGMGYGTMTAAEAAEYVMEGLSTLVE